MVVKARKALQSNKSLHDKIIGELVRPHWLKNKSLLDNQWIIQVAKGDVEKTIDFDTPITSWPHNRNLTDPSFELDLITVKMVVYLSFKSKPVGWVKKGSSAEVVFGAQVDFVRWRTDRGVPSNRELTAAWFNEFDRSFQKHGREGLLRLVPRATPVLEAIKEGTILPGFDDRKGILANPVAKLVGVANAASLTDASRAAIERFMSVHEIRYSRTSTSRDMPPEVKSTQTAPTAHKFYRVWLDLWRLRGHLSHDTIGYRAFTSARKLSEHVGRLFPQPNRTEDAPAYQTSYLINSALKLLLDPVCEKIIELISLGGIDANQDVRDSKVLEECNDRLRAMGFPPMCARYHNNRWHKLAGVTVYNMVFKVLLASARIVTAAFSARRDGEIASSPVDCIIVDDREDTWLNCLIVKNVDQMDRVPVPRSVARAVDVVKRIRALGNKQTEKLYDFSCPILRRPVEFDLGDELKFVNDYFSVPLLDDGSAWKFKPHQFRKFFAVTYYWRWAFPDLTALSYHLRHFNPDTTRAYIEMKAAEALRMRDEKHAAELRKRDIERKKDFDATKAAFVFRTLKEVADGGSLGGSLGREIEAKINALTAEFLPQIHVTEMDDDNPSFDRMLADLAATVSLEPHPEGLSLCGFGSGPGSTKQHCAISVCLLHKEKLTGQPSATASKAAFGFADPLSCLACGLRVSLPSMFPKWEEEVRTAEQALIEADPEFAPYIKERIRKIREYA